MDRNGTRWSYEEDLFLLQELANGKTVLEIAILHGRTTGGISSRVGHIAAKLFSIDEIILRHREKNKTILFHPETFPQM